MINRAMHSFAQTNIQLLNQLCREGYSTSDLQVVVKSYELVILLMTGRFRASGKTFIAHLVGTASILGSLHVSSQQVAAGLLHAVYLAGDFGDGQPGISDTKRQQVRAAVGEKVEEYVSRYTALPWTDQTIRAISSAVDSMAAIEREVVLIRLANELEEYLDLGILYCGDEKRFQVSENHRSRLMVLLAEKLGFPDLVRELTGALDEMAVAAIPPELRRPDPQNSSFLLAPQSYQRLKDAIAKRLRSGQGTIREPTQ